jgi:sialate O-acetylesterase
MKISPSLKYLLFIAAFLIVSLIITRIIISRDKWLYYRICCLDNPSLLVESEWMDLNTRWNTKNADSIEFSRPDYNDNHWRYERQLYLGLIKNPKGYSWFRKSFRVPAHVPADSLILQLSLWDIHAQVYINGIKIADSCYVSNGKVYCNLPGKYLKPNKHNILAVRSNALFLRPSDQITSYTDKIIRTVTSEVNFTKTWKIMKGDNMEWKSPAFNDSSFVPIKVPGSWDDIYKNYDGKAWYRTSFRYSGPSNKLMLLVLGKIDDYSEIYINGIKIGGEIPDTIIKPELSAFDALNAYQLNSSILTLNNTIAVRVLDTRERGGIYSGPFALISMDNFYKFHENSKK